MSCLVLAGYVAAKGLMIYRYRFVVRADHALVRQYPWETLRYFGELFGVETVAMRFPDPFRVAYLLLVASLATWGLVVIAQQHGRRLGIVLGMAWAGSFGLFWTMRSIGLQEIVPRYFQYLVPMFCLCIGLAIHHVRRTAVRRLLWLAVVAPQTIAISGYWQQQMYGNLESAVAYLAEHANAGDAVRIEPDWMRGYYPAVWRETQGTEWPFKDATRPARSDAKPGDFWTLELVNKVQRDGLPVATPRANTHVWSSTFEEVLLTPPAASTGAAQ